MLFWAPPMYDYTLNSGPGLARALCGKNQATAGYTNVVSMVKRGTPVCPRVGAALKCKMQGRLRPSGPTWPYMARPGAWRFVARRVDHKPLLG